MEMLYELVDARYSDNRFTIVTTNQDLDEIKSLSGGRIYSRLLEMCHLVPMNGVDFRKYG
jgi:DNA replication protein DnaC